MHLPHKLRATIRSLVELGDLAWMLDDHQEKYMYNHFRDWQSYRHEGKGAKRFFMFDAARQTGKTYCSSLILSEDNIRQPKSKRLYGSATAVGLAEFVIPNLESIYEQFPEDLRPVYSGRHKGQRAMYRFPNGSELKLVGIDDDPKGLRGPKLNAWCLGEAAFIAKLKSTVSSVLTPQMQRIPDAYGLFESSAPEETDHDFDMVFKPICERNRAYVFMTIDHNTALSEESKKEILDEAREIDANDAEREFYGKRVRSKVLTVFPEFDRQVHVYNEYEIPKHGLALASYDPGQKHLFAVSWSVYDYIKEEVVFVDDWSEHNASTEKVAAITAAREYDLFGTRPPSELFRLSIAEWSDLLGDDRTSEHVDVLHELANKRHEEVSKGRKHKFNAWAYDGLSEYKWYDNDAKEWRANPHLRVSDTNLQLIRDMGVMFGFYLNPTTKDDLRKVMVQLVRSMLKQQMVKFGPLASMTAAHMNACTWHKNRKEWVEHKVYSHFDLAATVVYGLRFWESYFHIDPYPPKHLGRGGEDWVGEVQPIPQQIEYGDHW